MDGKCVCMRVSEKVSQWVIRGLSVGGSVGESVDGSVGDSVGGWGSEYVCG